MCWPANTVGAFFIAVLIFDMIQKNYGDIPYHALAGVVVTFLFWLVCSFVSVSVSGALLIVPAVFLTVFLFTVWFMNESLKQRGCCMNCNGVCNKKARLVKREQNLDAPPEPPIKKEKCVNTLTGTTTVSY
jgi:hypothetical protein